MSRVVRLALAGLLVGTLFFGYRPRASADLIWCLIDPVLVVNGQAVNLKIGVPQDQRTSVTSSTLVVTVPGNVNATLAGANAPGFPVNVSLRRAGVYAGTGPVPVTATAVVVAPPGTPALLQAWQPTVGALAQTTATAGATMAVTFGVR